MRRDRTSLSRAAKNGAASLGMAAFAIVCCGAIPLLAGLASTVAIGAILGVGAAIIALVGAVAIVVIRARRVSRLEPRATAEQHHSDPED